ncbi:MAG: CPBP family intramembrane metalloprotease [Deltaproteobacteria bacterium]|nr:CPBP family intramembrane metalloprotease [Deltaproteobacteria bacterium]
MSRRKLALECSLVTLFLFLFVAALHLLPLPSGLLRFGNALLTPGWILLPWILLTLHGEPFENFGYHLNDLRRSIGTGLLVSVLLLVPYFLLYRFWIGKPSLHFGNGHETARWLKMCLYQFTVIALPEEFYFRGYLQTRLNRIWGRPHHLFGAPFGPGLIVTSLIFMFFHLLLAVNLWNVGIFFSALVFGWLREKTDSIIAPILFHALSNIALFSFQGRF